MPAVRPARGRVLPSANIPSSCVGLLYLSEYGILSSRYLKVQLLEDRIGHGTDDQHDQCPYRWHVGYVFTLFDCFENAAAYGRRMREERGLRDVRGHGGGYESGLDGQHV